MKRLLLACLFAWCGVLPGNDALAADRLELSLPKEANLKDVFDAGLRPVRVSGLENRMCEVRDCSLSVSIGGRMPFNFEVGNGSFYVMRDNWISRTKFTGKREPIAKAVLRIKEGS